MIILRLMFSRQVMDAAFFEGGDEHSDGFALQMPMREYEALGSPLGIEFVASSERLSVGRDNDVRERVA